MSVSNSVIQCSAIYKFSPIAWITYFNSRNCPFNENPLIVHSKLVDKTAQIFGKLRTPVIMNVMLSSFRENFRKKTKQLVKRNFVIFRDN
jgi:hypothetical protein